MILFIVDKLVMNAHHNFPESKAASSNYLFCPIYSLKPKYIQFTIIVIIKTLISYQSRQSILYQAAIWSISAHISGSLLPIDDKRK